MLIIIVAIGLSFGWNIIICDSSKRKYKHLNNFGGVLNTVTGTLDYTISCHKNTKIKVCPSSAQIIQNNTQEEKFMNLNF